MEVSERGLNLIKRFEGLSLKPYLCPAKIPTMATVILFTKTEPR